VTKDRKRGNMSREGVNDRWCKSRDGEGEGEEKEVARPRILEDEKLNKWKTERLERGNREAEVGYTTKRAIERTVSGKILWETEEIERQKRTRFIRERDREKWIEKNKRGEDFW